MDGRMFVSLCLDFKLYSNQKVPFKTSFLLLTYLHFPNLTLNEQLQWACFSVPSCSNNVLDATKAFRLDLTDPADVKDLPESLKQLMAANAAEGQR